MAADRADVVLIGVPKKIIVDGLAARFNLHVIPHDGNAEAAIAKVAPNVRGAAVTGAPYAMKGDVMARLPKLELVSSFGVGYDNIDVKYAAAHGITVTHTPDVLNEEVADTTIGLLLGTIREFPQADRFIRAGRWPKEGQYPLSAATLRDRTIGIVGLGRIGKAIARRLEGFGVPIAYHSRNPQPGVSYRYYPKLVDMARDVDTLIVITPGGAATKHLINAEVLAALGPRGIVINMARGSVIDDDALIKALKDRTIHSVGLDVFVNEPEVPREYLTMDHIVLLPHLGSASVYTRQKMEQLVVDNLLVWSEGKPPLTPVPETPWPPQKRA
ncbi:MAG: 2-hydroxyacid dehydrogenase [Rhizobiales bacterium]|jgi:lactate dehydrogenase-like 2-hydroxyacid dehydrogenase|nr:2-hydroxyacid dehydrogenase [Hyphomicrobiales bacterium]